MQKMFDRVIGRRYNDIANKSLRYVTAYFIAKKEDVAYEVYRYYPQSG
jgi:hypothetical protein